jgi:hypothetical protein
VEQVQPGRKVAVQSSDRDAGVARDPLQGGVHASGGELSLRGSDELVVEWAGILLMGLARNGAGFRVVLGTK